MNWGRESRAHPHTHDPAQPSHKQRARGCRSRTSEWQVPTRERRRTRRADRWEARGGGRSRPASDRHQAERIHAPRAPRRLHALPVDQHHAFASEAHQLGVDDRRGDVVHLPKELCPRPPLRRGASAGRSRGRPCRRATPPRSCAARPAPPPASAPAALWSSSVPPFVSEAPAACSPWRAGATDTLRLRREFALPVPRGAAATSSAPRICLCL
jgi:hypothetical protein